MSEKTALSEAELDALMDTVEDSDSLIMDDGSTDAQLYDFSARERALFAQIPRLKLINEKTAVELSDLLQEELRQPFQVSLKDARILSIEEAYDSVAEGAVINLVRFLPLQSTCLIEIPGELISEITDRYFGGSKTQAGSGKNESAPLRTATPSELRINQKILRCLFQAIIEGWQEVVAFKPEQLLTETSMQFVQPSNLEDNAVCISYQVSLGEQNSIINWILPYANLESLRQSLGGLNAEESHKSIEGSWEPLIRANLMKVPVISQAILTEIEVSLGEVSSWKKGSVVPIRIPDEIFLKVEGVPIFRGELGSFESNKAIKLRTKEI